MTTIDRLRDLEQAATPGPWGWTGNLHNRQVELSTLHSGRLGVMRFERWGMTSAQPVFLDPESVREDPMMGVTTVKVSSAPVFEVCREATSADDPRVYRSDIVGIRNPDAALIPEARNALPALLDVAEAARALSRMNEGDTMCCERSIHTRGADHHGCQWHDLSVALARLDEP